MGLLDVENHALHRSVSDSLTPDAPPRPGYEGELYQIGMQARGTGAAFSPLLRQRMADITDTSGQRRRVRGIAAADTAQQAQGGTPFERAMTRGRALSKIGLQGQMQVDQRALRDRFAMARLGNNVRMGVGTDLNNLAGNQAEQNAAMMRAEQQRSAAMANMSGAVVGGVASAFNNMRSNS